MPKEVTKKIKRKQKNNQSSQMDMLQAVKEFDHINNAADFFNGSAGLGKEE